MLFEEIKRKINQFASATKHMLKRICPQRVFDRRWRKEAIVGPHSAKLLDLTWVIKKVLHARAI